MVKHRSSVLLLASMTTFLWYSWGKSDIECVGSILYVQWMLFEVPMCMCTDRLVKLVYLPCCSSYA